MNICLRLVFVLSIITTAADAFAQTVTTNTQFTATDPVYQLPVTVDVAVTNPALFSGCPIPVGCQPNQIEFVVTTLGLVVDAQRRFKLPASTAFDPNVHFEKISTVTGGPLQSLRTTIYRITGNVPGLGQTQLEIRCQRASSIVAAFPVQGVSITYSIVGLTSVTHPITATSCPPM